MNDRPSGVLMDALEECSVCSFSPADGYVRARSSGRDRDIAGTRRRFGSDGRGPVPRQQLFETRARPPLGHLVDDAGHIGMRVEAIQLGRFNDRINMRSSTTTFVAAHEKIIFSCDRNLGVILPISGRLSLSTIAGIRCMGEVRGVF